MTVNKIRNEYDEMKGLLNKIRRIQESVKQNDYGIIKEQNMVKYDSDEPEVPRHDGEVAPPTAPPTAPSQAGDKTFPFGNKKMEINRPDLKPESSEEQEDLAVINNVEIEIHSEDPEDLALSEEEKKQISQLIDDFRTEVSEIVEFDRLHIYDDSAKLDGKIDDMGLAFTMSTGDDTGLYISNPSMLKIDDESLEIINKLRAFTPKFSNTINDLLVNRSTT